MTMDIHVYDTYVKAKDGHTMHFDVITVEKDPKKAIEYAKQWLETIGEEILQLQAKNANFVTHKGLQNQLKMRSKKRDSSFKNGRMSIKPLFALNFF